MLKKHNMPLAQLSNRIQEINSANWQCKQQSPMEYPILKRPVTIIDDNEAQTIYKEVVMKNFDINDSEKSKWLLMKNKQIIRFLHTEMINNEYMMGAEIKHKQDLYSIPLLSSTLNIFEGRPIEKEPMFYKLNEIEQKMFGMNTKNGCMAFFPLISY